MKTFKVILDIRAECPSDANDLIQDYTGQETDVEIKSITEILEVERGLFERIAKEVVKKGIANLPSHTDPAVIEQKTSQVLRSLPVVRQPLVNGKTEAKE